MSRLAPAELNCVTLRPNLGPVCGLKYYEEKLRAMMSQDTLPSPFPIPFLAKYYYSVVYYWSTTTVCAVVLR